MLTENGLKSVSELSQQESSHCDDEVQPGTTACTPHVMQLEMQRNPNLACFGFHISPLFKKKYHCFVLKM